VRSPPVGFWPVLSCLGPGLIIAGSVVGSGELIAATKVGAEAGTSLLWLIIVGCVIKVFVQIELGRYAVTHGETTLSAMNRLPGPRYRANWLLWYWLAMMLVIQAQLGAILGGVGQAMAIAFPFSGDYSRMIEMPSTSELKSVLKWDADADAGGPILATRTEEDQKRIQNGQRLLKNRLRRLGKQGDEALNAVRRLVEAESVVQSFKSAGRSDDSFEVLEANRELASAKAIVKQLVEPTTWDDRTWAIAVAMLTVVLLYRGQYSIVQNVSTVLVVSFTFITVGNVISLQFQPEFSLSTTALLSGLIPRLPPSSPEILSPLFTALSAFGIIGVGGSELIAYPYWCLEKGYARFTGVRTESPAWAPRARGWMRVMLIDALASMVVYTIATLAFFLMGAAVLRSQGLNPEGMRMIGTLLEQYVPVFGEYARWLFLLGAVAVLYSTVLSANAGNARQLADGLRVFRLVGGNDPGAYERIVRGFCVGLPMLQLVLYCTGYDPVQFVMLSGMMQALILPMMGAVALYHRYHSTDDRLRPTQIWDTLLWISVAGLFVTGLVLAYQAVGKAMG
jgi:Mn2+/Fe2+ NRAMP family transporter